MKPVRARLLARTQNPSSRRLPCGPAAFLSLAVVLAAIVPVSCGGDRPEPPKRRPAAERAPARTPYAQGYTRAAGDDSRAAAKIEHMMAKAGVSQEAGTVDPFHESTPLHDAAGAGDLAEVRSLVADGADLESIDSDGLKPIHVAVSHDRTETVALLIELGADPQGVKKPSPSGRQPIHLAAHNGNVELVVLLLDAGVPANALSRQRGTPLHVAARQPHREVVEVLLARGGDATLKNRSGYTPLHSAAYGGDVEIARLLLEAGAPIDDREVAGTTALYMAAQEGHEEFALFLVDQGADLNMRFPYSTITYRAGARGHKELASKLAARGGKWQLPPPEPGEEVFYAPMDPRVQAPHAAQKRGGGYRLGKKHRKKAAEADPAAAPSAPVADPAAAPTPEEG